MENLKTAYTNYPLQDKVDIVDFINPFVQNTLILINKRIDSQIMSPSLRKSIEENCQKELFPYIAKVAVTEFEVYKIQKDNAYLSMENFIKDIFNDEKLINTLTDIYPYLFFTLFRQSKYIAESYIEILTNLKRDKNELVETGLLDKEEELISVKRNAGDGHQNYQKVAELKFTKNTLFYKPKNSIMTLKLFQIQKWIEERSSITFHRYKILNKETYAYEEEVTHIQIQNIREINKFFYNFGVNLGLIYILNGSDYHFENLIAHKTYPVMIDNETLFNPGISKINSYNHLLYSGMLPNHNSTYEHSALSGSYDDQVIDVEQLIKKEERYVIEKKEFHIERKKNKPNSEMNLKDIYKNKLKYIHSGFEDLLNVFLYNKQDFLSSGILESMENEKIRIVPRPTKLYIEILQKLTHPYNIKTKEKAEEFIHNSLSSANSQKELVDSEKKQLLNGDIPIFHVNMTNNRLVEVPEFMISNQSPYTYVTKKIQSLTSQEILDGINNISKILSESYQKL